MTVNCIMQSMVCGVSKSLAFDAAAGGVGLGNLDIAVRSGADSRKSGVGCFALFRLAVGPARSSNVEFCTEDSKDAKSGGEMVLKRTKIRFRPLPSTSVRFRPDTPAWRWARRVLTMRVLPSAFWQGNRAPSSAFVRHRPAKCAFVRLLDGGRG
jgi:hypothetical protein